VASTPPEARAGVVVRELEAALRVAVIHPASPLARTFADESARAARPRPARTGGEPPDDRRTARLTRAPRCRRRSAARSGASARVVHRPGEPSAAGQDGVLRSAAVTTRDRDVEVRIGTVAIELRAPPTPRPPTPAPAPTRTPAPAPRTDARRFSPSRHHLRWN
jgi:hypothetical protein